MSQSTLSHFAISPNYFEWWTEVLQIIHPFMDDKICNSWQCQRAIGHDIFNTSMHTKWSHHKLVSCQLPLTLAWKSVWYFHFIWVCMPVPFPSCPFNCFLSLSLCWVHPSLLLFYSLFDKNCKWMFLTMTHYKICCASARSLMDLVAMILVKWVKKSMRRIQMLWFRSMTMTVTMSCIFDRGISFSLELSKQWEINRILWKDSWYLGGLHVMMESCKAIMGIAPHVDSNIPVSNLFYPCSQELVGALVQVELFTKIYCHYG